ncbi:MAG: hypothetical protein ACF8LL_00100, partial [Phycisphaerales bacterium]
QAVAVGVGLLDVAALERNGAENPLRGLWSEQAVRPQIVVLASDARAAADFGEIAETEWISLVLSIEGRELAYAVARALIIATGRRLRALVDEARHLPYEVRSVLRHLTRRVLSGPGWEDHPPPPHQIADLARENAVSRAHHNRRLDARPVDLRALAEIWLAMQTVCIKGIENPSLGALAERAGYRSRTGLSALGRRALGVPAGAWSETRPAEAINACTAMWSRALRGPSMT